MIVFDRLWKTMKEKNISQYKLIKDYNVSPSQIHRIKKNQNISTYTANMFCEILHCRVEDIMEYIPDGETEEQREKPRDEVEKGPEKPQKDPEKPRDETEKTRDETEKT